MARLGFRVPDWLGGANPRQRLVRFMVCCAGIAALMAVAVAGLIAAVDVQPTLSRTYDIVFMSLFAAFILFLLTIVFEFWPLYRLWRRTLLQLAQLLEEQTGKIERLTGFASISADLLWETDLEGYITYFGGRMRAELALRQSEVVGSHYLDIIRLAPDDLNAMRAAIAKLQPYSGLLTQFHDRDGASYIFELDARPLRNGAGSLIGYQGVGTDVTEKIAARSEMEALAIRDPLTGLLNRRAFSDRLERLFGTGAIRKGVALLAMDLDGFKHVNDTYGHDIGDGLLQQAAARISHTIRDDDWCARLGGDEFVVVCEQLDSIAHAEQIAERLLKSVSDSYQVDGVGLIVGTSIGISLAPAHADSAKTLIKHADLALYQAKATGRSRTCTFSADLGSSTLRRKLVEEKLRRAITNQSLELVFQPIVLLETDEITGFEALARWTDEEVGEITPTEFILVAEECGLICELGHQVIRDACFAAADWQQNMDRRTTRVCVNVSPAQFRDIEFVHVVEQSLTDSGLHPNNLELEVTENLSLENFERHSEILKELKALGVSVAIDDFGAGYSSLSRLNKLSIDRLKNYRSIIENIAQSPESRTITNAIVQLARNLDIRLVAEGIECPEQVRLLRAMGCPEGQGYVFSKPVPADQIGRFFAPGIMKVA